VTEKVLHWKRSHELVAHAPYIHRKLHRARRTRAEKRFKESTIDSVPSRHRDDRAREHRTGGRFFGVENRVFNESSPFARNGVFTVAIVARASSSSKFAPSRDLNAPYRLISSSSSSLEQRRSSVARNCRVSCRVS
jgi:hypothetical protein